MWSQRQTPRSSLAASKTFGHQPGPTYGNRFRQDCLALQQPSTKPGPAARRPRAQRRRRAQDGQGEGGVGQPVAPARRTARPCGGTLRTPASKTRGGSLGLRAYSMTPGDAALQAGGLRARLTGTTVQLARACRQPHSAHLPSCASASAVPDTARFARKISCAKPARRWPRYSCPSARTTSAARAPPAALGSWCPQP